MSAVDWLKVDELVFKQGSKAGLRGKVNAKCISCLYDPTEPGTWRKQVSMCMVIRCPLYEIRPQSKGE